MTKSKSKKREKAAKHLFVKRYPFDFDNNELYEPTKDEQSALAMKTLPSKHPLTRIDYMQWERDLVERGKYKREDLKPLTFSEALQLKQRVMNEAITKLFRRKYPLRKPIVETAAPKIPQKLLEPLSPKARLIYEKLLGLKQSEAMTTPEILDWLSREHQKDIDEGTFGKLLKEIKPYGLKNKPRIGYYIQKIS